MNIGIWRRRGLPRGKYELINLDIKDFLLAIDRWKTFEELNKKNGSYHGFKTCIEYVNDQEFWNHLKQHQNHVNKKPKIKISFYDTDMFHGSYVYEDPFYTTADMLESSVFYYIRDLIDDRSENRFNNRYPIDSMNIRIEAIIDHRRLDTEAIVERYFRLCRYKNSVKIV